MEASSEHRHPGENEDGASGGTAYVKMSSMVDHVWRMSTSIPKTADCAESWISDPGKAIAGETLL